jgi:hypothetical protein
MLPNASIPSVYRCHEMCLFFYRKLFFAEKMEILYYLPLIARRQKLLKEARKLLKGAKIA